MAQLYFNRPKKKIQMGKIHACIESLLHTSHTVSFNPHTTFKVMVITYILQMKTQGLRGYVTCLDPLTSKCQSWESNHVCLILKSILFPLHYTSSLGKQNRIRDIKISRSFTKRHSSVTPITSRTEEAGAVNPNSNPVA